MQILWITRILCAAMIFNKISSAKQRIKSQGICSTWDQHHYHTFDGRSYNYYGSCSYALAIDCRAGSDDYAIHVENDKNCHQSGDLLCKRAVLLFVNDIEYRISSDNKISIDGKSDINLPYLDNGVSISRHSDYTFIEAWDGKVVVKFDGVRSIYVQLDSEYRNNTCGLCGNYNGNPVDDFQLPNDQGLAKTSYEFGNSWAKPGPSQKCASVTKPPIDKCLVKPSTITYSAQVKCQLLIKSPEFSKCHSTVDPLPFFYTCKEDMCACNASEECRCPSFEQYSRKCAQHGVILNWRSYYLCSRTCSKNQVYMECGPSCTSTCNSAGVSSVCKDTCIDGCHCPENTSLWNGTCVPAGQCPCIHNGRIYLHGQALHLGCKHCTCAGGYWKCNAKSNCEGHASVYGNGHYTTFDGKEYDYAGKCQYIFTQTEDRSFAVILDRAVCKNKNCHMIVYLKYKGNAINLIGEDSSFHIYVNGHKVASPYVSNRGFRIVQPSSVFIMLETTEGINILWDGETRLYVKVPSSFAGKLVGLGGNFNSKTIDDFLTPSKDVSHSANTFGNSWMVRNSNCSSVSIDYRMTSCEANHQVAKYAETQCAILLSDVFSDCHRSVDPQSYYLNCKEDVCACNGRKDCLCSVLSAYFRECALSDNVYSNWRNMSNCEQTCPAGRLFTECGSSCTKTCEDVLKPNPDCKEECMEGCSCPDGHVVDDITGTCVANHKCGCHDGNRTVANGGFVMRGCATCVCSGGSFRCSNETCTGTCSNGKQFSPCVKSISATCRTKSIVLSSFDTCLPGCACPKGMVEYNGTCINKTLCPCYHSDKEYGEGKTIHKDCNTCECVAGEWSCTQKLCSATCSVFGNSHYKSFDGKEFEFQGECGHVMVTDLCRHSKNKKMNIQIKAKSEKCGSQGITCTREVDVYVHGIIFQMAVGNRKVRLISPQTFEDQSHYMLYEHAGSYVQIATDYGISLLWDNGTRLYITAEPMLSGKLCGLCGDFDGNEANDFITFQGDIAGRPIAFGDSWRSQNTCPLSKTVKNTCKERPHRLDPAKKECSVIKSNVFHPCHKLVDPVPFYEKCVYDTCGCDMVGDCNCVCSAVSSYAKECLDEGVAVSWMGGHHICEKYACCRPNMTYSTKGSGCPKTCKYPDGVSNCPVEYVAGCQCPHGLVQNTDKNGNVHCIKPEECNVCRFNGHIFMDGEIITYNCKHCLCSNGFMNCKGQPCPVTTPPPTTATTASPTTSTATRTSTTTEAPITTPQARGCFHFNGTHNITLPVGGTISLDKCSNKTCKLIDANPEVEIFKTTCEDTCDTGCDVPQSSRALLADVPGKCCQKCLSVGEVCVDPGFLPCNATLCIPKEWFCDGNVDCTNGRDEECCATPPSTTSTPATTTGTIITTTTRPCIPPKKHTSCAPVCEEKCHSLGGCDYLLGIDLCVPGCVCPNGTVSNGTNCVSPAKCSCIDSNAKIRQPDEVWPNPNEECSDCRCYDNRILCSKRRCPPVLCSISEQHIEPGECCAKCQPATTSPPLLSTTTPAATTTAASTTTEQKCDCTEVIPVGVSDGRVPDKNLTSPSIRVNRPATKEYTGPEEARLFNQPSSTGSGSWEPKDSEAYLQVDFDKVYNLKEIRTQGSPSGNKFVTRYFLFYTIDGVSWTQASSNNEGDMWFQGNQDGNTVKISKLSFSAKSVKVYPANDLSLGEPDVAMRVEFYICPPCAPTSVPTTTKVVIITEPTRNITHAPQERSTTRKPTTLQATTEATTKKKCDCSQVVPVGVHDGRVPDKNLTSPSIRINRPGTKEYTGPEEARLFNKPSSTGSGAWEPKDLEAYLQVDFDKVYDLKEIRTQGSPSQDKYVARFFLFYTTDGDNWEQAFINEEEPWFVGNKDGNSIKTNKISFSASSVRIYPANDPSLGEPDVALRVEFYICPPCGPTTTAGKTAPTTAATTKKKCDCAQVIPVGVYDGRVPDKNLTSPSIRVNRPGTKEYTGPEEARLHNKPSATGVGAWEPKDSEAYLQIDFDKVYSFREIRTQGSPTRNKYVARYFLFYTVDGINWESATQGYEGDVLFDGNADGNTVKINKISFKASSVKIYPANDPSLGEPGVALRVELYVCPPCGLTLPPMTTKGPTAVTTKKKCDCAQVIPVGVYDGRVPDKNLTSPSIRVNRPGTKEYTGPEEARLHNKPSPTGIGAWEPKDSEAYLQIDFDKVYSFREIRTQGSPVDNKYVARFFLFYTTDGMNWETATNGYEGDVLFDGNTDGNTVKINKISFKASSVKIYPANDPSLGEPGVALRVELYVCPPCGPTAPPITTEVVIVTEPTRNITHAPQKHSTTQKPTISTTTKKKCDCTEVVPVGVNDGRVPDKNLTSPSIKVNRPGTKMYTGPEEARLYNEPSATGVGAWEPKDSEAYIQIDFDKAYSFKEIRTQGSPTQNKYVARFFLFYTADGISWETATNGYEGDILFDGNTDGNTVKINKISFKALSVKIYPANDPSLGEPNVALRVELYVCPPCGPTLPPMTTKAIVTATTRGITTKRKTTARTTNPTTRGTTTREQTTARTRKPTTRRTTTVEQTTASSTEATTRGTTTEEKTTASTTKATTRGTSTKEKTVASTTMATTRGKTTEEQTTANTTEATSRGTTTEVQTTASTTKASTRRTTTKELTTASTTKAATSRGTTTEEQTPASTTKATTIGTTTEEQTTASTTKATTRGATTEEQTTASTTKATTRGTTTEEQTTASTTKPTTKRTTTKKEITASTTKPTTRGTTTEEQTTASTTKATTQETTAEEQTTASTMKPTTKGTTTKEEATESTTKASTKRATTKKKTTANTTKSTIRGTTTEELTTASTTKATSRGTTTKKQTTVGTTTPITRGSTTTEEGTTASTTKATTRGTSTEKPTMATSTKATSRVTTTKQQTTRSTTEVATRGTTTEEQTTPSTTKATTRETTTEEQATSSTTKTTKRITTTEEQTTESTTKATTRGTTIEKKKPTTRGFTAKVQTTAGTIRPTTRGFTTKERTTARTTKPTTRGFTTKVQTTAKTTMPTTRVTTAKQQTTGSTTKATTRRTTEEQTTASTTKATTRETTTEEQTTMSTTKPTTRETATEEQTTTKITKPTTRRTTTEEQTTASTTNATTKITTTKKPTTASTTKSTTLETTTEEQTISSTGKPTTRGTTTEEQTTASTTKATTKITTTKNPTTASTTLGTTTEEQTALSTSKPTTSRTTTEEKTTTRTTKSTARVTTTEEQSTTSTAKPTTTTQVVIITEKKRNITHAPQKWSTLLPTTQKENTTTKGTTLATTTTTSTTMRTTVKKCDCSYLVPVGVSDGRIPDKNMKSPSIRVNRPGTRNHTGPEQARLNNEPSETGSGAWEPKTSEAYLQIDFNKVEMVKEIKMQGSPTENKYVSRYFISYTDDGKNWKRAHKKNGNGMLFTGNINMLTQRVNKLSIEAKSVRIFPANVPTLGEPDVALRVEFYVCPPCEALTTPPATTVSTTLVPTTTKQPSCTGDKVRGECSRKHTCDSRNVCETGNDTYVGCCCPGGLYSLGDRCVKEEECLCLHNGKIQREGDIWYPSKYEICRCKNGKQDCSTACPPTFKCAEHQKRLFSPIPVNGSCCKCVNDCQYCKIGQKYVPVGTTVPISIDSQKCVSMACVLDEDKECAYIEKDVTVCNDACPKGMKRQGNFTDCCRCVCDLDQCNITGKFDCRENERYTKKDGDCCGHCEKIYVPTSTPVVVISSPKQTPGEVNVTSATTTKQTTLHPWSTRKSTTTGGRLTFPPFSEKPTTNVTTGATTTKEKTAPSTTKATTTSTTIEEQTTASTTKATTRGTTTKEQTTAKTTKATTRGTTTEEQTTSTTKATTRGTTTEKQTTASTTKPTTRETTGEEQTTSSTTTATTGGSTTKEQTTATTTKATTRESTTKERTTASSTEMTTRETTTEEKTTASTTKPTTRETVTEEQVTVRTTKPTTRRITTKEKTTARTTKPTKRVTTTREQTTARTTKPTTRRTTTEEQTTAGTTKPTTKATTTEEQTTASTTKTTTAGTTTEEQTTASTTKATTRGTTTEEQTTASTTKATTRGTTTEEKETATTTEATTKGTTTKEQTTASTTKSSTRGTTTEEPTMTSTPNATTMGITTKEQATESVIITEGPRPTEAQKRKECTVQLDEVHLKQGHCISLGKMKVASCSGRCDSQSSFDPKPPYYTSVCRCCKPVAFENVEIRMICNSTSYSTLSVPIIKECDCNECNDKIAAKEIKTNPPVTTPSKDIEPGVETESIESEESGSGDAPEDSGKNAGSVTDGTSNGSERIRRTLGDYFRSLF